MLLFEIPAPYKIMWLFEIWKTKWKTRTGNWTPDQKGLRNASAWKGTLSQNGYGTHVGIKRTNLAYSKKVFKKK